jgi:hypothetical protein
MNKTVKEMVRQDIQGNNKTPTLTEVKQIAKICKEVHRKYGTGQAYDNLGRNT